MADTPEGAASASATGTAGPASAAEVVTLPPLNRPKGVETSAYIPLPTGLSDPAGEARSTFDQAAHLYDRARPGYPGEAVAELERICRVDSNISVLEVGCGTGQLTRDLAVTGARIHCVEAGPALAALARKNLAPFAGVEVTTSTFEAFDGTDDYDVVVSATAFHWIDPNLAFPKAARMLTDNGYLALLTNVHSWGGSHTSPAIIDGVRDLHRRLAPEIGDWTFPTSEAITAAAAAPGDIAEVWAKVERKLWDPPRVSDLFQKPIVKAYPWLATYDTDAYLAMLATQSSYALMEQPRREQLLAGIGRLIDQQLAGVVTKEYVTVLAVARRVSDMSRSG